MKKYTLIKWIDHIVDRYTGRVIQQGTPLNQENMNHMDEAIYENREQIIVQGKKLSGIEEGAQVNKVTSVNNKTGAVTVTKADVGLGNVPNVATNDQTPTFTPAAERANLTSGEKLSVMLGKLSKWFADLKTVAFTGKYSDLTGRPAIPAASGTTPKAASGNGAVGSETAFARGDHVHPAQTSVTGNAGTATKLQTPRTINGVYFDGSGDIILSKPAVYGVNGKIIDSTGGTLSGVGGASVIVTAEGFVTVDFNVKITTAGTNPNVFEYGLSIPLLRGLNKSIPAITPISGGRVLAYWQYDGERGMKLDSTVVDHGLYGTPAATHWSFARIYNDAGAGGNWTETVFYAGAFLSGTVYGTVS